MNNRKNISKKPRSASGNTNSSLNNKVYNSTPSGRFYTLKEEITLRFYQTPKALFKNPKYRDLSLGPKLMYSILRDRLDISIKNNWKDEKGYIYLIFSVEELASLLEMDRTAVMRYKKKLVEYNLIIDKRLGQGNPNRIYILKPELSDGQKSQKTTSGSPKKGPLEVSKCNSNDTYINETNLNNVNRAGSKWDGVVNDMHHPSEHAAPPQVNEVHPNNTNIKRINLNHVNKTSREEVLENSKGEIKEETAEDKEDINDIRRKIKESLEEKGKCNFIEPKNSGIEMNLLEKNNKLKGKYSINSVIKEYPESKRYRLKENDMLAKEIAEVLEDSHSLGAFRAVVDKISEQQIRIFLSIIKDTHLTRKIRNNKGAMFISLAKEYAKKNNIDLNFK